MLTIDLIHIWRDLNLTDAIRLCLICCRCCVSSDQAKPSRVLGVFGLSLYTDERVLKEVFSQYGPVEGIQVILDHHSGISRGFGFIYMRHLDDAIRVSPFKSIPFSVFLCNFSRMKKI